MLFADLAAVYADLGATTKRLEKTKLVADALAGAGDDLSRVVLLLQGRVFPRWDKRTLGVSSKLVVRVIARTAGVSESVVNAKWRKIGDLGLVAADLLAKKRQATLFQEELSVEDLFSKLQKLSSIEGSGSVDQKISLISSLLSSASPESLRYVLGIVLEELRVGVAEGVLRDAIAWAFLDAPVSYTDGSLEVTDRESYNQIVDSVQHAYDRCSDFAQVAKSARKGGLEAIQKISFELGVPIRVMLAPRETTAASALDRVGVPGAVEFKYDGFRMQVHKRGDDVQLFTRRLENVTEQFPDVVAVIREHISAKDCLLDGEAVGLDPETGQYVPFQHISQRIRRKYDIEDLAKKLPVELVLFDLLYLDGVEMIREPFIDRHKQLVSLLPDPILGKLRTSDYLEFSSLSQLESFYQKSLDAGNEGVMVKSLSAPYRPGARVGHWVKLKPTLETMDLVIVGAEWGEGKRSGWLTSFTLACYDAHQDEFLPVGKVGTGLKELASESSGDSGDDFSLTFGELTDLLRPHIIDESGREVVISPRIVIEIKCEEIQKSPTYGSGFALRFPRVVRLRRDRAPDDILSLDELSSYFEQQKS